MKGKTTRRVGKVLMAVLIATGITITGAHAQSNVSYHIGPSGGPQFTTFKSDMGKYSGRMGFQAGISQEVRVNYNFGMQLDLFLSGQGAKRNYKDSVITALYSRYRTIKTEDEFDYAQAHLLFKLNLPFPRHFILPYDRPGRSKTFVSIFAGPYFGYLNNAVKAGTIKEVYQKTDRPDSTVTTTYTGTYNDSDKVGIYKIDVGFTAGLGINFKFGDNWTLNVDGRYSQGFSSVDNGYFGMWKPDPKEPINKNGVPRESYTYANMFNNAISVNIGLKYRIFGQDE